MSKIILVTGGARSGKSQFAEDAILGFGREAIYIATAEIFDDEMAERVKIHRARRDERWRTIEAPLDLAQTLLATDAGAPRLVDCLTLWLTNLMMAQRDWRPACDELLRVLARQQAPVVLVTNEVGAGITPDNALARAFQDNAGALNQRIAAAADDVYFVACGLPLRLKPAPAPT